jgi:hypothetical protein
MRLAIAAELGWSRCSMHCKVASGKQLLGSTSSLYGTPSTDKGKPEDDQQFLPVPDYPNDLNAMREAEDALFSHTMERYANQLAIIVGNWARHEYSQFYIIHATARQRAEAFLRTLRKWEESD